MTFFVRPQSRRERCPTGDFTEAAPRLAGPAVALRVFVAEARRAGLSAVEAAALVREAMS